MEMVRIVVIDDEYVIRKGIIKIIEMSGQDYQVVGEASDGQEGQRLLFKVCPDIAVVDVKMPKKNGLDMIEECIDQGLDCTRFIVLSAYDDYVYTRKGIKLGICDYLLKPVNRFDFLNQLEETSKIVKNGREKKEVEERIEMVPSAVADAAVKQALRYIDRYFYQDLTLTCVSEQVHMHPNYFGTLFKKETGVSYLSYLTSVRMDKAKELLDKTDLKIYEIGQIVGYYSPKHFAKLFKKHTNMTPNEYRERKRSQNT